MGIYWKASHSVYDCRYHIVWITKYRRKCLNETMQVRIKTIIQGICEELHVKVIRLGMEEDHLHLYCTIPPVQPIPYVVELLKGRTSKILRKEQAAYLSKFYWKQGVVWRTAIQFFKEHNLPFELLLPKGQDINAHRMW